MFRPKDLPVYQRVEALCRVFGQAQWGLSVGFYFLQYSGVCTVEPLSLFYLFLYLDLFVPGDDASISKGYFILTKHLFALIHIRIKGHEGTV